MTALPADPVYLATRVHARYGSRREELRPEVLVRHRTPEAFWRAVVPDRAPAGARAPQRRLLVEWCEELEALSRGLGARRARLLGALAGVVELEDRKVLVRGGAAGTPADALAAELLRPAAAPSRAPGARGEPAARPSPSSPRDLGDPATTAAPPRPFALETALDQRHAEQLVAALRGLAARDRRAVEHLVLQEVDQFQLMLVARGRFTHRIAPDALLAWHVAGAGIARDRLRAMLAAPDLGGAAALAVGIALDALPPPAQLDARTLLVEAWRRFLRLAHRTFREGATAFATLVGYAGMRRVEVMDLTTLSEGVRLHEDAGALLARLLRPPVEERRG